MKVRFTPRARRRAKLVAEWWSANRPAAPQLFQEELAAAVSILGARPGVGIIYAELEGKHVRRLLMPRTEQYAYYVVDPGLDAIVIHTVWGARRGRGPKLEK